MPRWFVIVFLTLGGLTAEAQTSGTPASGMGQRVSAEAASGYQSSSGATCRRRTVGRVTAVVDLTGDILKGVGALFGPSAVVLEGEA